MSGRTTLPETCRAGTDTPRANKLRGIGLGQTEVAV